MLDQILNTVKEQVTNKLTDQIGLTQQQAEKSVEVAGECTTDVIREEAARGKTGNIMKLFTSGKITGNPLVKRIETMFLTKLSSSLNITGSKAESIKDMIMPVLLTKVSDYFRDSGKHEVSDLLSVFGISSSGLKESFGSKLSKFFKKR